MSTQYYLEIEAPITLRELATLLGYPEEEALPPIIEEYEFREVHFLRHLPLRVSFYVS